MDKVQKILDEIQRKLKDINPHAPENDAEDEAYENGRIAMALYLREFIEHL